MSRNDRAASATQPDDLLAVARCRAGSIEDFAPLVQRHSPRIVRLCYHFVGDWEEARDLAQDTFARAYHCLDRYDATRPFDAWLTTIAARLATDRLRRRRSARRGLDRLAREQGAPAGPPQEISLSLKEALDHLTPRQRQSVVLCDLHGLNATEAAVIIGCTASTVRVLRFLARRRLRAEVLAPDRAISETGSGTAAPADLLMLERGE